ncbi:hypothetical protein GCM10012279_22030 [Micromonospora yangpuensis]|uniref:Integral membrane protein n=2 Tax=Micromonospora yangpuensis TaxID=683228 RepID=A0A1C6UHS3_9ACTN|nr:hypothetical protein GCM10012279_22030 [Micromonospora yangpuensis]SCL53521.1 hypothetical protein GA0070617_2389 [Micromonospora yangpuensis]
MVNTSGVVPPGDGGPGQADRDGAVAATAGREDRMRGWLPLTLGLLAVVVGALWTVQGLGYVGGSIMSDQLIWAVIGPVLTVVGLVVLRWAMRARRRP